MHLPNASNPFTYLILASCFVAFALGGCVQTGTNPHPENTPQKPASAVANIQVPQSLGTLKFNQLNIGDSRKWRFEKDDPQILAEGTLTHFKAFKLPIGNSPVRLKVETSSSFEIPHFPVKYLFCPRILLLDANHKIVFSSDFDDLKKRQRLLGEPRFIFEHTLPTGKPETSYLIVIRERDFDGHFVKSIQAVDAPLYDELLRRERERIYASPTGPVRLSLKN